MNDFKFLKLSTMDYLKFYLIAVLCFNLVSCTKEDQYFNDELNMKYSETELRVDSKRKDERACIVDNKAGIECFVSVGNTCKKLHACTPVSSEIFKAEQFFTPSELNDWLNTDYRQNRPFMLHMWEMGYFIHPDSLN